MIANTGVPHASLTALATLFFGLSLMVSGGGTVATTTPSPAMAIDGRASAAPDRHTAAMWTSGVFPARWPEAMSRDNPPPLRPHEQRTRITRLMPAHTARPARKTSAVAGTAYVSPVVPVRADRRADLAEMANAQRGTRRDQMVSSVASGDLQATEP